MVRRVVAATALTLLLSLVPDAGSPARPAGPIRPAAAAPSQGVCAPWADRTVSPLVLEEGRSASIEVRFGFDCPPGQRPVDLLLIENGRATPSFEDNPEIVATNERLAEARTALVSQFSGSSGSRIGYGRFEASFEPVLPLGPPDAWPGDLRTWATPDLATSGLLAGMRHAAELLPASSEVRTSVVVAVISSSTSIGTPDEIAAACGALDAAGIELAVVALEGLRGSGGLHDIACMDHFLRATDRSGADIAGTFEDLAALVFGAPRVEMVEVVEGLEEAFAYVLGSGSPRDPDTIVLGDLAWSFAAPEEGEHVLSYRVRGAVGYSDVRSPVSREAYVRFMLPTGEAVVPLPNPIVCLHSRRSAAFCATPRFAYLPALMRGDLR